MNIRYRPATHINGYEVSGETRDYEVWVQERKGARWRLAGWVTRPHTQVSRPWMALAVDGDRWTSYRSTRAEATADMIATVSTSPEASEHRQAARTPDHTAQVSPEATSLASALVYTAQMAAGTAAGAASVEASLAAVADGQVSGAAITHLRRAQEALAAAQAGFAAAHAALSQHVVVQEAYAAAPGAGSKQFVTGD